VTATQTATIGASYTFGGVTRTASVGVSVVNVAAPPAGAVTITPADGASDVPVNTVVTARVGSGDIRTIFNEDTFTLKPSAATNDSSVERSGVLASTVCVRDGVVQGSISYNDSRSRARFTPNCALEHNMTYVGEIASGGGSPSAAPQTFRFTTAVARPDSDGDGGDDVEDDHPQDSRKTGSWSPYGTGRVLIDAGNDSGPAIRGSMAISDTSSRLNQAGKPAGYEFPDGLVSFQAEGVTPGTSATFKVTFPSPIPAGSKVYKVGPTGFQEVDGATIQGNTITVPFTDGGAGASAGQGTGVIVDPVGVATPVTSGSGSLDLSTSSSGGGCAVAPGRTSRGAGAMAPLLLLLIGAALRRLRKPGRRK